MVANLQDKGHLAVKTSVWFNLDHLQDVLSLKISTWWPLLSLWITDYRPGVGLNSLLLYFILDGSVRRSTHHDTLTGLLLQDEYISKYLLSVLCNCMLLNLLVYHLWNGVGDESNDSIGGSVTLWLEHWTCNLEALSLTLTACWICSFVLSSPDFKSSTTLVQ